MGLDIRNNRIASPASFFVEHCQGWGRVRRGYGSGDGAVLERDMDRG